MCFNTSIKAYNKKALKYLKQMIQNKWQKRKGDKGEEGLSSPKANKHSIITSKTYI